MLDEILKILPDNISNEIRNIGTSGNFNEIRLRVGKHGIVVVADIEVYLSCIVTLNDLLEILIKVSKNSLYAIQNDINNGFTVIRGGHRIGICGEVVVENGVIKNIKNINSMNIRVARQVIGCADKVIKYIIKDGKCQNTLIVSPPGCGKTTLLRDVIRQLSSGVESLGFRGVNVGVVDERGEIASCFNGIINVDLGLRTDVMSNCKKSDGINMLVRSMGINVIATDEIGKNEDIDAIRYATLSGVKLVFTMHGKDIEDIKLKEGVSKMLHDRLFDIVIVLTNKPKVGTIEKIHELGGHI